MKTKTFFFTVTTLLLLTSTRAQELPLFEKWMKAGGSNPLEVEIKRDPLRGMLYEAKADLEKIVTTRAVVPLDAVTTLSPAGLRYLSASGIVLVPFPDLPSSLVAMTGWTPEIEARYKRQRKDYAQMANTDIAIARLEAAKAENRAWVEQNRRVAGSAAAEPPPATPPVPMSAGQTPGLTASLPADVAGIIRNRAAQEWPTDYSMQKYIVQRQTEAWHKLQAHKNSAAGVTAGIVTEAEKKWGTDYEMVCYEIKVQMESYQKLTR